MKETFFPLKGNGFIKSKFFILATILATSLISLIAKNNILDKPILEKNETELSRTIDSDNLENNELNSSSSSAELVTFSGPCQSGNIGGQVFNDSNANGIYDSDIENGEAGVKVSLFACGNTESSQLIEEVFTDVNGEYQFATSTVADYKLVFGDFPSGYTYSSNGVDNGSDVQFVTDLSCDNNLGLYNIEDVCAAPDLELTVTLGELFANGKLLGPGIGMITCGTILNLPEEERHTVGLVDIRTVNTANDRPEVNPDGWYHPSWNVDSIGNVFGIEHDTTGNIFVTASTHYSHTFGYVLNGDNSNYTNAVIKYGDIAGGDANPLAGGTIYKLDAVTGRATVFAQLPQQLHTFQHIGCENGLDPPLSRTAGVGLGNIVYDPINNQFFVSNFEDGSIYRLDSDGNILTVFDPQTLTGFAADDNTSGWASDAKPYGLAVSPDGSTIYFGTHELNTSPGLYSINLDATGDFTGTEIFHKDYLAEGDIGYLFALEPGWVAISDLEFLPDGRMMIALRTGCAGDYATSHNHGATFYIAANNDGDGIFDDNIINPDIQYPNDGTFNDDGYGGVGIWDKKDATYDFLVSSSDTRAEIGPHGLIVFPHDFTNGNSGFSLQPSAAIPYLPSFNVNDFKGVGGDVEVFSPCGDPAIHVGNYVWIDTNADGIQDPCESPVEGITVKLYSKPASGDVELVATTMTNALGQYYFKDNTSATETWESGFTAIESGQDYAIAFCGDSYDETNGIVSFNGILFTSTVSNSSDAIMDQDDSDMEAIILSGIGTTPAICFTADKTDFTYDAGFVQKPTVTIIDNDITCGPVEEGGSMVVSIEGGIAPFTYDWSEDSYDGMSNVQNVPVGIYSLTVTDGTDCPSDATVEITEEPCPPNPCESGELGGTVFNDLNANGANESGETGPQGVRVQIFGCTDNGDSEPIETVYTDANGDYHFTNPTITDGEEYRIEFSNLPEGLTSSVAGADNGTETQYIDAVSCDVDYGVINPLLYCQENPMMVTPCYVSTTAENQDVLIRFSYGNEGIAPQDKIAIAESQMTGSLWGVAYGKKEQILYTSAVLKGHIPMGPSGLDAIYSIDPFSDNPNATPWLELTDDLGIAVSNVSVHPQYLDNVARGLDLIAQNDEVAFQDVGKVGIGDIELSEDEETLYVVNLYDKTLYAISTSTKQLIASYPITEPSCSMGNARPWALAERNGEIYVGVTCDGSNSGDPSNLTDNSGAANLSATIYRLDGSSFTEVLSFPLDYAREEPFTYSGGCNNIDKWKPWLNVMPATCDDGNVGYPTPLLTDIEFAANGDMILGFTDRTGFQFGFANYGPSGTTLLSTYSGGDILLACKTEASWEIENTVTGCSTDGLAINTYDNNGYVPTFGGFLAKEGEFFEGDYFHGDGGIDGTGLSYFPGHPEITTGGLAVVPGTGEIISTAYDPVTGAPNYNTGGVIFLDLETGKRTRNGYQIYETLDPATTLGKGIGLGDLEALCDLAPIQIGNYVWIDANADGIQDPCEAAVSDLTVKLYSKPDSGNSELVATTTTNADGEYYFTSNLDTDESWEEGFDKVELGAQYYIVFCGDTYNDDMNVIASGGTLFELTEANVGMGINADFNDSDAEELTILGAGSFPAICFTADSINHTFDVGLLPKPDLALVQVLDPSYDPTGLAFGDSVKFKMVVTNQSLGSVDSVELTNYIPDGYTFDGSIAGNEDWAVDGNGYLVTVIPNNLASLEKDSVCLYLTIQPSDDPTEWINVAEISNAWSAGEEIEDCDSPLNNNPDDNVGSEINTPADDYIDGDGSAIEPNGVAATDQDNVDPATVPICDLALINVIDELPTNIKVGDTIKYAVIIENQGTVPATNIDIQYSIPNGLVYVDTNNSGDPAWAPTMGAASTAVVETLGIGEMDTVCIYLTVANVATDDVTEDSWTTYAEISAFEDPEEPGVDKSDIDSTPDSDPTNDSGGNPDDDTNDVTSGDGSGDPENETEDMNPDLDEDDHDPAIIYVCDAATIIYTDNEGPFLYFDTVKFNVVVYNQGNGPITEIELNDFLGQGLNFISTDVNDAEGWTGDDDQVTITVSEILQPGESDTICLELQLVDVIPFDEDAYLQVVEIASFEDPNDPGTSKSDIDSTPDTDPENDPGGNPNDVTDNTTNGDGTGDPEVPSEDTDPALDEDDNDPVLLDVFDLAITKVVMDDRPYVPGETAIFNFEIHNQGNVDAASYQLTDYLRSGFTFTTTGNPGWAVVGDNLVFTSAAGIAAGGTAMVDLSLTVVIPATVNGLSDWWNYVEISAADDDTDAGNDAPVDADSTPDNIKDNDNDVEPDGDDDNTISENGLLGDDEDDHDPAAVIVGYDIALIKTVSPEGPYSYGDTLTYTITLTNQGGLTMSNIEVYDSLPCGLLFLVDENADWDLNGAIASTTYENQLAATQVGTLELKVLVQRCDEPAYDNYFNIAEVSDFADEDGNEPTSDDIDSTPDDDPSNDGDVIDNDIDPSTEDEDDHDTEDLVICDIALINTIAEVPDVLSVGDTIKYEVIVFNQGNHDVNSVSVAYLIPNGLAYLPINGNLSPEWMSESDEGATVTTTEVLKPGETDTVCLYLLLDNVPTEEATVDSWTTEAEITEYTNQDDEVKTTDADSTPDADPTNDNGGVPGGESDDQPDGTGEGDPTDPTEQDDPDLDEDDQDPAILYVCDVATIIDTEEEGPFVYGDTLKYFVVVSNQGNGDITNVTLQNLFGEGLEYVDVAGNVAEGWIEEGDGELGLLITESIGPGESDTICLYMEVVPDYESDEESWVQNVEVVSFEDPADPGVPKSDIDSTPDNDPENDPGGNPNDEDTDDVTDGDGSGDPEDDGQNTDPALDEDDQDVEDIDICDLALINTIVELNEPPKVGDTVKYEVIIVNQGNVGAENASIDYLVPNGFTYLPINDGLNPAWTEESDVLLSATTAALAPGESDTLCLYLQLENVSTEEVTSDSWTTIAEITEYTDEEGEVKTFDVDSTPDDDLVNDPGGNPGDNTDDNLEGDGTGDPTNPIEDTNPDLDEDDNDPAIVQVCDIATIIDTEEEGPFVYGDTLKYFVVVSNQGNGDITNVTLQNLFGEGLGYVDVAVNSAEGWVEEGDGELSLLITNIIASGESDTICLYMEVVPDYESDEESWVQNVEVVSFEDPADPGVSKSDIDSTPDSDPDNDPGGNPNDEDTDDITEGDGSGDPTDDGENTDPLLDEDDQDLEDIDICDLALINTIVELEEPSKVGDTVKYEVIVVNQGNVGANSVNVDYLVPNGFTYLPVNDGLDPAWTEESDVLLSNTTAALAPGESDTLCLYLQLENVPTEEATEDSWTTVSEITDYVDENGDPKTEDVDSTPDDDLMNDVGGNPGDATDDTLEGDGTGDPLDPADDMNPDLDEDDNDPAIVDIYDVATIIYQDVPDEINYYDILKYNVVVSNQGNTEITNVSVVNHIPDGFEFVESSVNTTEGWVESEEIDDAITVIMTDILAPGESDTICLELEIVPVHEDVEEESWVQVVEVLTLEDPISPGVSVDDFDSTPDSDPDNDSGGNPDDTTDDVTDGEGTGDPENPTEDMNPALDEDDNDPVDTKVLDLALVMQIDSMPPVLPVVPGDVLKFIVVVSNQGNTPVNEIELTNYLMDDNLVLADVSGNKDWEAIDSESNETVLEDELLSGESDTVCIYLEVIGGAMSDIVTYSEISGSIETDGGECYDIDSTPDDINSNDEGGTPVSAEDDHIEDDGEDGNEDGITDEDDHDPAMLDVQDLALIVWSENKLPVLEGDDVKFTIRVINQGNILNENIEIVDYIPSGFELSENDTNNWTVDPLDAKKVSTTLIESLDMGDTTETCIILTVQDGVNAEDLVNYAEIVSSTGPEGLDLNPLDVDSTPNNDSEDDEGGQYEDMPDCSTDPFVINDDNNVEGAGVIGEDEDDHDPAWVHVFDLASIIYTDQTLPVIPGDEVKFNVVIENQGNMSATEIELLIDMPTGFTLSANDDNGWDADDNGLTTTYEDVITPSTTDTVCLILEVLPDHMFDDMVPVVEITGTMDTLGNDQSAFDLDSNPNEDVSDDEGGEIFTADDDNLEGNGEEGEDEDDQDPAVPPVMDLAIKIVTEDELPKMSGDLVKFIITVYNQGSLTPSEFSIENYVPDGLIFVPSENPGWVSSGATDASYTYTEELAPLTSDTLCLFLLMDIDANPMNVVNMVEISQVLDQNDIDVSLLDIDSEADASNENDLGNDLYSAEDNKIDENGRSGLDEDDHDQAFVLMCQGIACKGAVNFSLDENCIGSLTPRMLLAGDIFPDFIYEIIVKDENGMVVPNEFGIGDVDKTFEVSISNPLCDGNSCWLPVTVEYKFDPSIECVTNDTLSCVQAFSEASVPSISDNCVSTELLLIDEVFENLTCDTAFTAVMTRKYIAKDIYGNTSDTCTQEIYLERTNLDSISTLTSFAIYNNRALDCGSGFATTSEGYPHPALSVTGAPRLKVEDGDFVDLFPFDASVICNGFAEYHDEILPGSTSCVTKILRTFIIGEWWCSSTNERTFVQLIEIVDFEGPEVTCPSDITISTSSFECESMGSFTLPTASDMCNDDIRIDLSTPAGFIADYNGGQVQLPVGEHELTYNVYDGCNNLTECSFTVTVQDNADPIAICDQFTEVGISLESTTYITAEAIDDGSFDECGPVTLSIARMDDPGFEDFTGFGQTAPIYCADTGGDVMVGLLVTDAGGNTNMCMVTVSVKDKVEAQMVCPGPMMVECNFAYDSANLGAFFGYVEVYDNCPGSNILHDTIIEDNITTCGNGTLVRRINLLNAQNEIVNTCTQTITFANGDPLQFDDITPPPAEVTVSGCGVSAIDPEVLGMPIIPNGICSQTGISIENDTFPFTQSGACLKILRKFSVIDWCINDGPGSILDPWEFEQIIKVSNTEAPTFSNVFEDDSTYCSFAIDCGGLTVNGLTADASDDCTPTNELQNTYQVIDANDIIVRSGFGHDASGYYDLGQYVVKFISGDKCGNQSIAESSFEIKSCKQPTPYCLSGLSTTLTAMDTDNDGTADAEMVMITPSFFDAGSYHSCGLEVTLSFSEDINDTIATFFCSDTLELQEVELWVTALDVDGNPLYDQADYCVTTLDVQNNEDIDLCVDLKPVNVQGRIYTNTNAELEDASVELRSTETQVQMTDEEGEYGFMDMPQGGAYQVAPVKDDDVLNGVSTLDLVMIQRHLLGIQALEGVYKYIAADINNDEKLTAQDLLALRKVILGVDTHFENNTSWRFIDEGYEFEDATDPWLESFPETYNISALSEDMWIDFIGVKTGDVNGNVSTNVDAGVMIETRSGRKTMVSLPNVYVEEDKVYELEVELSEAIHLKGMQHALDMNGLEVLEVIPGQMNIKGSDVLIGEEQMKMSYANAIGDYVQAGDRLYTLVVRARQAGDLSEMIRISDKDLVGEAYRGEILEKSELELEWREESDPISSVGYLVVGTATPNPWRHETEINFELPESGQVSITIRDASGRLVAQKEGEFSAGKQKFRITEEDVNMTGLFFYDVQFGDQVIHKKMIRIE